MSNTSLSSAEELYPVLEQTLELAKQMGATAAEAGLSQSLGMSVNSRLREVETVEQQRDNDLSITVFIGKSKGSSSTASFAPKALQQAVEAAIHIARYTSEDECNGLADAELMASKFLDLDLYHEWDLSADAAIELAIECESAALDRDPRIVNSEGAGVELTRGISAYANTHGFIHAERGSRYGLSCSVVAEADGKMQRDYWYSVNRVATALESAREVGIKAADRTLQRLGSRSISTCKAPVLFVPELARGLISSYLGGIRGSAQYRQASFLLNKLGEQIFPDWFSLQEQPFLPRSLGAANYDAEGVATQAHKLVEQGVINSYLLDSYSARRLGRQTTGHASGVHNLQVSDTGQDFAAMLKLMDRGFVVTELMGHGVNNVTGDYSRGAAGFWVENGELAYPVEEVTVAGNLLTMFQQIQASGTDRDLRGNIRCGSLLIEQMTIGGAEQ